MLTILVHSDHVLVACGNLWFLICAGNTKFRYHSDYILKYLSSDVLAAWEFFWGKY